MSGIDEVSDAFPVIHVYSSVDGDIVVHVQTLSFRLNKLYSMLIKFNVLKM